MFQVLTFCEQICDFGAKCTYAVVNRLQTLTRFYSWHKTSESSKTWASQICAICLTACSQQQQKEWNLTKHLCPSCRLKLYQMLKLIPFVQFNAAPCQLLYFCLSFLAFLHTLLVIQSLTSFNEEYLLKTNVAEFCSSEIYLVHNYYSSWIIWLLLDFVSA